jgi:hypothetical protein
VGRKATASVVESEQTQAAPDGIALGAICQRLGGISVSVCEGGDRASSSERAWMTGRCLRIIEIVTCIKFHTHASNQQHQNNNNNNELQRKVDVARQTIAFWSKKRLLKYDVAQQYWRLATDADFAKAKVNRALTKSGYCYRVCLCRYSLTCTQTQHTINHRSRLIIQTIRA